MCKLKVNRSSSGGDGYRTRRRVTALASSVQSLFSVALSEIFQMLFFQHVMHNISQRFSDMQMDRRKLSWTRERGVGLCYKVKWLHLVSVY